MADWLQATYWDSTADYVASWSPAVDLEAAASAADEAGLAFYGRPDKVWEGLAWHGRFFELHHTHAYMKKQIHQISEEDLSCK